MAFHTFCANNLLLLALFLALPLWASVLPIEVLPSEAIEPRASDSGMDVGYQFQYEDGSAFSAEHASLVNIHHLHVNVTAAEEGLEKRSASFQQNCGPREQGFQYVFDYSACDFPRGIRPYSVACLKINTNTGLVITTVAYSQCAQNEICVDSFLATGSQRAYCLPQGEFQRVAVNTPTIQFQDVIRAHRVPLNQQIQAMVMEATSGNALSEAYIGIRSRQCFHFPGTIHCNILAKVECSQCFRETLAPISRKTTNTVLVIKFALQTAVNIYVATFSAT